MAGTAKAGAAKTSAPPAKLGKAPAKVAPPAKAKPAAKAKGAAAEKAPAAAAVSLKQLAAGLAESHDLPKRQVEAMMGRCVRRISGAEDAGARHRPDMGRAALCRLARQQPWPVVLPHPEMLPRHLSLPHQHAPVAS